MENLNLHLGGLHLSELWHDYNTKERRWRQTSNSDRKNRLNLKLQFNSALKLFKQEVRRSKRRVHVIAKENLLKLHRENNSKDFFKQIGRLGISSKKDPIPFIDNDPVIALQRWYDDFSNLFSNKNLPENNIQVDETFFAEMSKKLEDLEKSFFPNEHSNWVDNLTDENFQSLNQKFSVEEVRRIVNQASVEKSFGFDQIHNKIMKTETSIRFLHSLFNFCF
eukprot:Lithocolla_globosa_v1_NODE_1703_length_2390_cov_120.712206.p1 type:complete len:222 gc:universal NODE_1703_length_2390_cov_120.712206:1556-2221(+)